MPDIKIYMPKGSAEAIAKSKTSIAQRVRMKKSIDDLRRTPLDKLIRSGRVHELTTPNDPPVYVYRMGIRERIVFSEIKGDHYIHDVIDLKRNRSLLSNAQIETKE